ncbi:AT-rich interactive domain-containing protein 3C-like isoform X2 [Ornithodoros turicata]|uniref:AT-rich interactive domain-containing protein 3C-like isoform X2 n=1 Tax=Ornithodoros turicata TaxID=34597 RepID=UPI003139133C
MENAESDVDGSMVSFPRSSLHLRHFDDVNLASKLRQSNPEEEEMNESDYGGSGEDEDERRTPLEGELSNDGVDHHDMMISVGGHRHQSYRRPEDGSPLALSLGSNGTSPATSNGATDRIPPTTATVPRHPPPPPPPPAIALAGPPSTGIGTLPPPPYTMSNSTPPPHMLHLPPTLTPVSTPQSTAVTPDHHTKYLGYDDQHYSSAGRLGKPTEFSRDFKVSPSSKSARPGRGDTNGRVSMDDISKLYELSEDPKRKEFLDDLFAFMQKRGTPVNRIPIMAKQVLDLYELYRLVVSRGGLVEVINKKIWREITKGLNLPSSITSAAFTLRTQYMKYLYPYECEKEKLSQPDELQAAIDGNRREGRRSSYSHYADMMARTNHHTSPISLVCGRPQANGHAPPSQGAPSSGEEDNSIASMALGVPQQQEALNLEVPRGDHKPLDSRRLLEDPLTNGPPPKRFLSVDEERLLAHTAQMPTTHIKVISRGDGRTQVDSSMVVTMDINGITYQGVLFAQTHRSRLS